MARRRIVLVHADLMAKILNGSHLEWSRVLTSVTSNCPADMRVVGCGWDEARQLIRLAVESETFDDIEGDYFAPEFQPIFTQHSMTRFEAAMEVLKGD